MPSASTYPKLVRPATRNVTIVWANVNVSTENCARGVVFSALQSGISMNHSAKWRMMADQYIVLINKRDHLCTLIDIAVPCEFHVVEEQKEKVAGEM